MPKIYREDEMIDCPLCGACASATGHFYIESQSLEEPGEYTPLEGCRVQCTVCGWDDEKHDTSILHDDDEIHFAAQHYAEFLIANGLLTIAAKIIDHNKIEFGAWMTFDHEVIPNGLGRLSYAEAREIHAHIDAIRGAREVRHAA